ncbi:unnamed protein product [Didymodactylos carnosus]|uniref:Uncharacterized protein n=1 Tax=Didymodactylos carnosus TaxID=1234261 RepID=A0A815R7H5_9BILA|nr:unnamed protein product [Didymodactylos carnosus]CAF4340034.1 unnamed protein product [Didymodactylos carnosus]
MDSGKTAKRSLRRVTELSDEIIQKVWEQLLLKDDIKDEQLKYYLICASAAIVAQQKFVPTKVLETIENFLTNKIDTIEMRIVCVQILSKEIKSRATTTNDSLKQLALESRNNKNDDLLINLYFKY